MELDTLEAVIADMRDETFKIGEEQVTAEEYFRYFSENVSQYIETNPKSTNMQLFSVLSLLNAYVPKSYLMMSECQEILGPPDPIHGGPPFERRMEPFTAFIRTFNLNWGHICLIHPVFAKRAVDLLPDLRISRNDTLETLFLLCGEQAQPHLVQFIKDLLTMRKMGEKGKNKFSGFIEDILEQEDFFEALTVLRRASKKFTNKPIFPQTVSRLNYIAKWPPNYKYAKIWAKIAIKRAPCNSYVADTLGQVYKNCLIRMSRRLDEFLNMEEKAFTAFKDVERKAEKEDMEDGSNSFNNRGLFGFIQVAKIAIEKFPARRGLIQNKRMEVENKFEFFEWYLTYSMIDMKTFEPFYFWRDVAICYNCYTTKTASESTSFPGILDFLNHGLFISKGRRAGFEEHEKTVSDLEAIQDDMKNYYERNDDDVNIAERYILSNIILSNRMPVSPQLTPVRELQTIIHKFLGKDERHRSPEFFLLVLLLFWPEEEPQVMQEEDDEEVDQQTTEDNALEDNTWEDEDSDDGQEPAQQPLDLILYSDLQQYVIYMEEAFERAKYAKYLRGRYLLPLFFLGKGSGLSKWIHKSRLDAIVERKVDADLPDDRIVNCERTKIPRINNMWITGKVWQIPEIQDMLLPVRVEPCSSPTMSDEHEEQEMFVHAGGKEIKVSAEDEQNASVLSPTFFYLGFNIRGPVLFKVGVPQDQNGGKINRHTSRVFS